MPIPAINSSSSSAANKINDDEKPRDRTKLNPEDFIKLFMAQLQKQDPMKPTDSGAILEQMSQISSIQSSNEMSKSMANLATSLNSSLASTQLFQATQLVGKKVVVQSHISPLVEVTPAKDDKPAVELMTGSISVPKGAMDITVTIKDDKGNKVAEIHRGSSTADGVKDFEWDGMGDDKVQRNAGFYQITASATVNGQSVDLPTAGTFQVQSVALDPQKGVMFNLDGIGGVPASSVIKML